MKRIVLAILVIGTTLYAFPQHETLTNLRMQNLPIETQLQPRPNIIPLYYPNSRTIDPSIFEQMIEDFQEATFYPGMSICLLRDGSVYWKENYGYADVSQSRPVNDQTIYTVASISKTIMITAVMQLYEQGMLELDDDISDHIPLMVRNPNFPQVSITIRQLATHISSIRDNWEDILYNVLAIGDNPIPMGDFLEGYLTVGGAYYTPDNYYTYQPGSTYNYSNTGSCLLAYMVECLTGIDFETYCQEHIFGPMYMTGTSYFFANLDPAYLATPYWILSDGTCQEEYQLSMPIYPIGSLKTSALQLAKHLGMYMNYGKCGGVTVLDSSTIELITTIHYAGPNSMYRGLIWLIDPYLDFYSHSGAWLGMNTIYGYNDTENYGMIWLANGRHWEGTPDQVYEFWDYLTLYSRQYTPFSIESLTIDDADGDHIIEAGENVSLNLGVRNNTNLTQIAYDVTLSVSTNYDGINFTGDTILQIGNVAYLEEGYPDEPIHFSVGSNMDPCKFDLKIHLAWNESIDYDLMLELHAGQADILVVNDENDTQGRLILTGNWYLEALDSLGYDYQYYDLQISGTPTYEFLKGFPVVIWLTGYDAENTLTEQDQLVLSEYLDNGGKLFLTGQNISEDIEGTAFLSDYLHAVHVNDTWTGLKIVKGIDSDPFFTGLQFSISGLGSTGAENQVSPSVIDADEYSGGEKCLGYFPNQEGCGVRYEGDYKTVFLSFGFEAITTKANRVKVMERVLHYFDLYVGKEELQVAGCRLQVFPNPARGRSQIKYQLAGGRWQLAKSAKVRITLHEITGRQVMTLLNETQQPGENSLYFNTSGLPAGIYLIRLQAGDAVATKKLVVLSH